MRWVAPVTLALALAAAPAAEAKTLKVNWREQLPISGGALRFHVTRIAATPRSWTVTMTIENASDAAVAVDPAGNIPGGASPNPVWHGGIALLEYHRVYSANVAGILGEWWQHLAATGSLPHAIAPRATWSGTFGGSAKLRPHQAYNIGLGAFTSRAADAGGKPVVWITDHSFAL